MSATRPFGTSTFALAAVLAAGAVHALPAGRADLWWLQPLCVGVLAAAVAGTSRGRAALLGGLFATAWGVAATWWLFISMHRYGGLPAPLAAAAVVLLAAFLAIYLAMALAAVAPGLARHRVLAPAGAFAGAWTIAELARGTLFTGFPWAAAGYGHVQGPLSAWAPWVGVYGIGALAAFAAAAAVFAWRRGRGPGPSRWPATAIGLAALAGVLGAPALAPEPSFTQPGATLRVALLQTNVSQDQKFSVEAMPQALRWTEAALLAAQADLVVGPETVIPLLPDQLQAFMPTLWPGLQKHFGQPGRHALIGLPLGSFEAGYTNSVAGLSAEAMARPGGFYRYDKHHLVPFGEFIPTGFRWFTDLMNIPLGDFARGPLAAPSFEVRLADGRVERIGPNICYEDLFGEELAARFVDPATAPTILANVSNIGWFGDTVAIPQHLQISRLRALELQRPMLRATNTGATAIVDHRGRVTHALAPLTRGVLTGEVQGRTGVTPYAAWAGRVGLWPLLLVALLLMLPALRRRRAP
ncbi:MAG: apolipoprotein N-acyltransferase [Ideonella sp.]|nr:apolipoprotein N-acyltransferase [Ideonella sp.]